MEAIFYIFAKVVAIYLNIATYSMLGRMLLQFFIEPGESQLYALLFFISEPVILPFRLVMAKLNIGQDLPIDLPFMAASVGVTFIQMLLPVI